MKYIEPIDFPGIDNILKNINKYKEKFLEDSVILFRNANLNYENQSFFHSELAKILNYHIGIDNEKKAQKYVEDHSKSNLIRSAKQNDILLDWHIEHVEYKNPIVISTWNMIKFKTDSENGKTYFIDSQKAYEQMPEDWKIFLNSCKAIHPESNLWDTDKVYPVIHNHWITGKPVIRTVIRHTDYMNQLVSVNDKDPTDNEKKLFEKISLWFLDYVYNNKENRIVQKWQEGDLLIVDIFKLAHAVTGGFDSKDREFIGMWGHKYKISY
jgi:alpha-ketoglutarate-dependent taurine dioxygenase